MSASTEHKVNLEKDDTSMKYHSTLKCFSIANECNNWNNAIKV